MSHRWCLTDLPPFPQEVDCSMEMSGCCRWKSKRRQWSLRCKNEEKLWGKKGGWGVCSRVRDETKSPFPWSGWSRSLCLPLCHHRNCLRYGDTEKKVGPLLSFPSQTTHLRLHMSNALMSVWRQWDIRQRKRTSCPPPPPPPWYLTPPKRNGRSSQTIHSSVKGGFLLNA